MDRLIALRGTALSPLAGTPAAQEDQQTLDDAGAAAASAAVSADGAAAGPSASHAAADTLAAAVPVAAPEAAPLAGFAGGVTGGPQRIDGSATVQPIGRGEATDARPGLSSCAKEGRAIASHVRFAPVMTHSSYVALPHATARAAGRKIRSCVH